MSVTAQQIRLDSIPASKAIYDIEKMDRLEAENEVLQARIDNLKNEVRDLMALNEQRDSQILSLFDAISELEKANEKSGNAIGKLEKRPKSRFGLGTGAGLSIDLKPYFGVAVQYNIISF